MPDTPSSDKSSHSFTDRHFSGGRLWVWLLVIILFGAGGFFLLQHQSAGRSTKAKSTSSPGAVPVVTATVRRGNIGVYINVIGTVTPVYTVTVTNRV